MSRQPGAHRRWAGSAGLLLLAPAVAALATACGSSPSARVAQLSTSTATRPSSTASQSEPAGALAFSHCVQAHGVPAYPDPSSDGLLPKKTPAELGVSSTELAAAQKACVHLAPNGGRPNEAQVARYRTIMLAYARCMRAHGVANMPDPDSRGHLAIGPGTPVAISSPAFQAAFAVCKSRLSP